MASMSASIAWRTRSPVMGCGSGDPAEAHILDLEIVLDSVLRALAAHAALLHTAEGCDLDRDDAIVDADQAHLQRLGDAEHAAQVTGIEVAGKAHVRGVGEPDHLLLGLEPEQRRHRPEGLLMGD